MARLPTRVRVTLAFSAVMALLLAGLGLFLYDRLGTTLNNTVDRGLRSRAGDLAALIEQADSGLAEAGRSPLTEQGESLAQVLSPSGRVLDAPPRLRRSAVLTRAEVARAARGTVVVQHGSSPVAEEGVRLLATPVKAQGRHVIVVVGASLGPVEDTQQRFGRLLLFGIPVALLLASLAGYGAAAGALRPVELMRRRAGEIRAGDPGSRLPVAPSHDEVARLGETLNEMLARLERAFQRESRFVADASHELRTPLAILKAELEVALLEARDVEGFRAAVRSAAEEADRVVQLAEDLLVIARSDQGRLPIQRGEIRAAELLDAVRRRFARRATEHEASVVVDAPDGLLLVGDNLRLEQALGNLIDNALRQGARTVELRATPSDGRAELHVADDGPGFPEGFLASAFERFARADTSRRRGGSGLGLAIVLAIARAHGGDAHARNRPAGGADVWLELPLRPDAR